LVVICIDESAHLGVIVAGLEVVKASFLVIDIAAVAEGVQDTKGIGHFACNGQDVAPGVVGVVHHRITVVIQDRHHIALQVGNIEVGYRAVDHIKGHTVRSMAKAQMLTIYGHMHQFTACVGVLVGLGAVGPLDPHTVGVIGIIPGNAAVNLGHGIQLSAVLPGVIPGAVGQGVADLVVGDGVAIIGSQKIAIIAFSYTIPRFLRIGKGFDKKYRGMEIEFHPPVGLLLVHRQVNRQDAEPSSALEPSLILALDYTDYTISTEKSPLSSKGSK